MNARTQRKQAERAGQRGTASPVEDLGGWPVDPNLARQQLTAALAELQQDDPDFAKASVLHPDTMGEWQAATFLLSGCHVVWRRLGAAVMESRSIGPVVEELENPTYGWSGGEREALVWAAHFWDVERYPAHFPYRFDRFHFYRWIVACHLRNSLAPQDRPLVGVAAHR